MFIVTDLVSLNMAHFRGVYNVHFSHQLYEVASGYFMCLSGWVKRCQRSYLISGIALSGIAILSFVRSSLFNDIALKFLF